MSAAGGDGGKKKYPPGTIAIWVAGAGVGLWLLISGLIGILSGGSRAALPEAQPARPSES